jgi:hypothetical protein
MGILFYKTPIDVHVAVTSRENISVIMLAQQHPINHMGLEVTGCISFLGLKCLYSNSTNMFHSIRFQESAVPFSKSFLNVLPITSFRFLGDIPNPGRIARTLFVVTKSPCPTFSTM